MEPRFNATLAVVCLILSPKIVESQWQHSGHSNIENRGDSQSTSGLSNDTFINIGLEGVEHSRVPLNAAIIPNDHSSERQMSEYVTKELSVESIGGPFMTNFGNMFDIRALNRITIHQLEIFTDLTTDNVAYEIYTTKGSYIGAKSNPHSWKLVARGSVTGLGIDSATPIPKGHFSPVVIGATQIQGFYITLTSANLGYTDGTAVGKACASNADLIIYEGSGVETYPLGSSFHAPRVWTGNVLYYLGYQPTDVDFDFLIEYVTNTTDIDEISAQIVSATDKSIKDAVLKLFRDETKVIKPIVDNNELALISVSSKMKQVDQELPCTIQQEGHKCSILVSTIKISHNEHLPHAVVRNALLMYAQDLVKASDFVTAYVGEKADSTKMVIYLMTGGTAAKMGVESTSFFEHNVRDALDMALSKHDPIVKVSSVVVNSQELVFGPIPKRNLREHRHSETAVTDSDETGAHTLDVHVTITGEYISPPDVIFEEVIDESLIDTMKSVIKTINNNKDFEFKVEKYDVANEKEHEKVLSAREDAERNNKKLDGTLGRMTTFFDNPANLGLTIGGGVLFVLIMGTVIMVILRRKSNDDSEEFTDHPNTSSRDSERNRYSIRMSVHSIRGYNILKSNKTGGSKRSSRMATSAASINQSRRSSGIAASAASINQSRRSTGIAASAASINQSRRSSAIAKYGFSQSK